MKRLIIITALVLSMPSWAYSQNSDEARITKLEQQVRLLTKKVKRLEQQIANDNDFSDSGKHMYQCKLRVFGEQYTGRSASRGSAIAKVVDECTDSQDEMFCRPDSVQCHKY
ncbi:hypothetical protein MD588_23425 [Photobacterium sp. SDRW27]|uniref:hypothetical protein n=1 Tax=Photobacterium obscurum TaxID=2829490 RepID=UPI002244E503|nr:hypothetical protein [Photobacterium obscurum]MCW8331755.1 hypothetical protein [Photobacterium obscurum]